jgi:ATP-dependent protease ClpP protease subunit
MIGTIYINGEIGVDTTLLDVVRQVKAQAGCTEFIAKIDSNGGYVDAGMDIYNYLKNLVQPVTTYTTKAYSIASVVFMAGINRIIPENSPQALLIHLPWAKLEGNHELLSLHLDNLKKTENELVDFYAKAIEIDKDTILSLLQKETFLDASQALELGFATELSVTQKAIARLNNKEEKVDENFMNKVQRKLDSILNKLSGKPEIKNELVLQDVTGLEIVFPELSGSDTPSVDDTAMVDKKPAEGDFTLPDNTVLSFKNGVVTDVTSPEVEEESEETPLAADETLTEETPAEETPTVDDTLVADLQAKVAELQAIIEQMISPEQTENLMDALDQAAERHNALETKFQALAKQVGSDFTKDVKDPKSNLKAKMDVPNRAMQILSSK